MMQSLPQSAFPDPRNNPVLPVAAPRIGTSVARPTPSHTLAMMRQAKGEPDSRIEDALGIKRGRLSVLGKGTVEAVALA